MRMKYMKKIISLMLASIILLTVGCGKKEEDFYLTYNGKNLYLNKEFTENDYGKYNDLFESESCAFGNRDIIYFYDDMEIEVYGQDDGKLIVYSIRLGENTETNEKISLYDLMSDAIKVYGNDYQKDGNTYTYTRGNTELIFITNNDIIESIEYRIKDI